MLVVGEQVFVSPLKNNVAGTSEFDIAIVYRGFHVRSSNALVRTLAS